MPSVALLAAPCGEVVRKLGMATPDRHGVTALEVGEGELHEHVSAAVEPERVEFDGPLVGHGG
jgi:hypothetical protein